MGRYTGATDAILRLLAEYGPMTRAEIDRELPGYRNLSSLVSLLTSERPANPRRAHICGWVWDTEGMREYPRAVYALGDKPNAKRPKPKTRAEIVARYKAKRSTKCYTNSIFNLAQAPRRIHAMHEVRGAPASHPRVKKNG